VNLITLDALYLGRFSDRSYFINFSIVIYFILSNHLKLSIKPLLDCCNISSFLVYFLASFFSSYPSPFPCLTSFSYTFSTLSLSHTFSISFGFIILHTPISSSSTKTSNTRDSVSSSNLSKLSSRTQRSHHLFQYDVIDIELLVIGTNDDIQIFNRFFHIQSRKKLCFMLFL
jgi:hypothetical protein